MKNLILCLLLFFAVVINSYAEELFASGIRTKYSNIAEPLPSRGRYFKALLGGFNVSKEGAKYNLVIEVIKGLDKEVFYKVEYENPLDKNKPFVLQESGKPANLTVQLLSGYIKGLEMFKSYGIKVIFYDPHDKNKEVDRLEQKIMSYVDTTGNEVKVVDGLLKSDELKEWRKDGR